MNAIKFSPNGLYLVAAGDGGNVVVYSVPREKRGGGNGQHYWSEVSKVCSFVAATIVFIYLLGLQ